MQTALFFQPDYSGQYRKQICDMHGTDMNSRGLDYTILTIAIIGAINWGLIGFFRLDLIAFLFGDMTLLSRIIYAAVGICGLYLISMFGRVRDIAD